MANKTADLIRACQQELARYRAYTEDLNQDSGILSISFQCLTDAQSKDVGNVLGVVALNGTE
jgi:hypothetical protein